MLSPSFLSMHPCNGYLARVYRISFTSKIPLLNVKSVSTLTGYDADCTVCDFRVVCGVLH